MTIAIYTKNLTDPEFGSCQNHRWTNEYKTVFSTQVYRHPSNETWHVPWGLRFTDPNIVRRVVLQPFYAVNGMLTRPPSTKFEPAGYTFHGSVWKYQVRAGRGWKTKYLKRGDLLAFEFLTGGIKGQEEIGPVACRVDEK